MYHETTLERVTDLQLEKMMEADRNKRHREEEGSCKREKFMKSHSHEWIFFKDPAEKIQIIREWYPDAYSILAEMLPGLVSQANDMPPCILHLGDKYIQHLLRPCDQDMLSLYFQNVI